MFKVSEKCPNCGNSFEYGIFRFNSTITCSKCHKKIYIETRNAMYLILFVIFLMFSDEMNTFVKELLPGQSEALYFIILLIFMIFAVFLVMFILIKLFGFTSIYAIRNDEFYTNQAKKAMKKKNKK